MKKIFFYIILFSLISMINANARDYLRGGDISMLNYVEDMGARFYTASGMQKDPIDIMKENGVNFVRLRLYNSPGNEISYTVDATTYN